MGGKGEKGRRIIRTSHMREVGYFNSIRKYTPICGRNEH